MPFMYILECSDRSLYVGSTWDLDRRLSQHNAGERAEYTRNRLPVRLLYSEYYSRIENAFLREKQVQRWGRAKRLALVKGRLDQLGPLSNEAEAALKRVETSDSGLDTRPAALLDQPKRLAGREEISER